MLPFEVGYQAIANNFRPVVVSRNVFYSAICSMSDEVRPVECWLAVPGLLLRADGCNEVYIAEDGRAILRVVNDYASGEYTPGASTAPLPDLDRAFLSGPALVLALALSGVWCLHASAALFQDRLTAFVGESGQGKSTLAAYLAQAGAPDWRLAADDILPATLTPVGVQALPHFPQLKLPVEAQPGVTLPERLRLDRICLLAQADPDSQPEIEALPPAQAVQAILGHTAGARLFTPQLLDNHLHFSAQAAALTPVYRLTYPHRREILPWIVHELESLC